MIVNQQALQAIYTNFEAIFKQRFSETETYWQKIATRVPSNSRQNDYKWIGNFPAVREWIGERQVQNLAAYDYSIKNKSFEATVAVDREDIEDDTLGIYTPLVQELADSAAKHIDILLFNLIKNGTTELCYDGKPFFSDQHKVGKATFSNYQTGTGALWVLLDVSRALRPFIVQVRKEPEFVALDQPDNDNVFLRKQFLYGVDYRGNVGFGFWQQAYGSKAELDATNYGAARAAMMGFKNEQGQPLGIRPGLLVVGPSNEAAARAILQAETIGGTTNIWRGSAELLVVPYLE